MKTLEYRTVAKDDWGDGPWQHEPDKVQWQDEATGLPCLAVRQPSHGALCGYVGVNPDHPLYKVHYSDCLQGCDESWCGHSPESRFDVHGGLTYSNLCQPDAEEQGVCHTPDPGEEEHVWWFGFDCAHFQDLCPGSRARDRARGWHDLKVASMQYRDLDYVRAECASLASRLAAAAPPEEGEE